MSGISGWLLSGQRVGSPVNLSGLARLIIIAPFFAPIVFPFDRQIARLFDWLGYGGEPIPIFAFVLDQYDFLLKCQGVHNIFDALTCKSQMATNLKVYDFQLFELAICFFCGALPAPHWTFRRVCGATILEVALRVRSDRREVDNV
jgi:hypothetical protein